MLSDGQSTTDQVTRLARKRWRVFANDIHSDVTAQICALLLGRYTAFEPRPMSSRASLLGHRTWLPGSVVPASFSVDGHTLAGHGSASISICLPAGSSGERSARAGSGGVYAVPCSVAVR